MRVLLWLGWLVFVAASAVQVSRTSVVTDASSFLPGPANPAQRLMIEQLRDGLSTRIVLVGLQLAVESPSNEQTSALVAASKALQQRLAGDQRIAWVSNGDPTQVDTELERVFAARYLLSDSTSEAQFSAAGLSAAFKRLQEVLVSAEGVAVKSIAGSDPTLAALQLAAKASQRKSPSSGQQVWLGPEGKVALLVLETAARGNDITALTETLQFIRSSAQAVLADWPVAGERPSIAFAGSGYFNVQSHDAIGQDALKLSIVAIVLVSMVLLWALRSPRFLLLAVVPVATGALAGFAVVGLTEPAIHGVTLAFGVTLIGEAVDYAIYTFVQADEHGRHSPMFWRQVALAMLTSLIGFAAMYFSGFAGLRQLGLFSIVGLIVAAACARWLLPSFLPSVRPVVSAERAQHTSRRFAWLPALADRMRGLRWPVLLLCLAMLAVFASRSEQLWQDNLDSLSASSRSETERDIQFRASVGVPDLRTMIAVQGDSLEQALQRAEATTKVLDKLIAEKVLAGYESPSDLLPSQQLQQRRQSVLPPAEILRARVADTAAAHQFNPAAFEPFVAAVESTRNGRLLDLAYYDKTILGAWLKSQIVHSDQNVSVFLLLNGTRSNTELRAQLEQARLAGVTMIDLKADVESLVTVYRERTMLAFVLGTAGIFVVLLFQMRSRRAALSMIATIFSTLVITAGLLFLFKGPLTLFNLVSLLLVVGVASNYTLFFSTLSVDPLERQKSSASVLLAATSTFIGFAVLAFSSTPVLAMIGVTVASGAVIGLLTSMTFSADAKQ